MLGRMLIWIDDGVVDAGDALVSVHDHGLTVGDGVFEVLKAPAGVPFALEPHLRRLLFSAERMGLPAPDLDVVERAVRELVAAFGDADSQVRITWTDGDGPQSSVRGDGPGRLIASVSPMSKWPATETIAVMPWVRNERGALSGVKTTSYGENAVSLARARGVGAGEAIFADTQGRLCEGTGSNIFVVIDGRVVTPTLDVGCLAGITRALVLEWTDAVEEDHPISILETADEVFLTSTTRDIHPVTRILFDGAEHTLEAGPITAEYAEVFARRSAEDR